MVDRLSRYTFALTSFLRLEVFGNMADYDGRRINPIVPEREGMIGSSSSAKATTKSANLAPKSSATASMGKGWKFFVSFFMIAIGCAGAFGWQQFSVLQANHTALQQRFDELDSRLSSTDESVMQSGAALQVKLSRQQDELRKHWSEIRKLWGVSNDINKGKITKNQTDITFLAQKRVSQGSALASLDKRVDAEKKRIGTISENYLEMSADLADLYGQLRAGNQAQKQASDSITRIQRQLESHSEAIESVDGFRRQVNQKIFKLEQASAPSMPNLSAE